MRTLKVGLVVLGLLCSLLLVGYVGAAGGLAIGRSVIGGGGQAATGDGFILTGTIGEPIVSELAIGTTYGLSSGFWWPGQYVVYLPLVQRS